MGVPIGLSLRFLRRYPCLSSSLEKRNSMLAEKCSGQFYDCVK
ncbi:hypothetical protein HMPREF9946_00710 [Acetobacteraceae bacterium AT-5844]|nr:hypothetical protein HMPREF9946_00710 [Acetobacteraceae bacterium AT-5844]